MEIFLSNFATFRQPYVSSVKKNLFNNNRKKKEKRKHVEISCEINNATAGSIYNMTETQFLTGAL